MTDTTFQRFRPLLLAAIVPVLLVVTQRYAAAQGEFSLTVADDMGLAQGPLDPMAMTNALCVTPADAAVNHAIPAYVLENTGNVNITKLEIVLQDDRATQYAFDMVDFFGETDPAMGAGSLMTPGDMDFSGNMSERIVFDFMEPIEPGKKFSFRAQLAPLPSAPTFAADYREILWNMTQATTMFADRTDNARVIVTFADESIFDGSFYEFLPLDFDGYVDAASSGFSRFATGGHHATVNAGAFNLSGTAVPIPEPSTWMIAVMAVAMFPLCAGRCRRPALCPVALR
jgi:hypothetical protein